MDLFDRANEAQAAKDAPLADRMRPRTLDEVVGQTQLVGPGKLLRDAIAHDRVTSMILWGPPGVGKTTLARVVAQHTQAQFVEFSAVLGGVPELRKLIGEAKERRKLYGTRTVLFIDEIHRFNKAQQDALLPHVERGVVTLIGATTENPSFAVNSALLSRARVYRLEALEPSDIEELLKRALGDDERGLGTLGVSAEGEALTALAQASQGDARRALEMLEAAAHFAAASKKKTLTLDDVRASLASETLLYDKHGEEHYNISSAFIKSMRGSDPDAAIYWMMRMLDAGEDPLFLARRMIIFASEDIGNADPRALQIAVAADAAFQRVGMPEGYHPLAHACIYLASAPKSNACYRAWADAQAEIKKSGALPVPLKLRNAVTTHMKAWGYGEGYRYAHDEGGFAEGETYLPDNLAGTQFYQPTAHGYEARIAEHLVRLREPGKSGRKDK